MSSCASALRVARALLAALFLVFTVGPIAAATDTSAVENP
jgi:hypothetical protein